MNAQQALIDLLVRSHDDPEFFFLHILRVPEWTDVFGRKRRLRKWQEDLLRDLGAQLKRGEKHLVVTVRTCHGAGKTWLIAGLALFIIATRPDSRILTTAPSWAGVEHLLWPEINRLYRGSILGAAGWGTPLRTEFQVRDTWYAVGGASDKPEKLEGHHSQVCAMRIVDEAKAVPDGVFTATAGMLDAPETWDVWISTPSIRLGAYYEREAKGGEGVTRKVVTADDLVADGIPGRAEWREQCRKDWGEASPEFQSRCLANYIDQAQGALYPFSWIERAMELDWQPEGQPLLGFDVAGSVDGDESVVAAAYTLPQPALQDGSSAPARRVVEVLDSWKLADTMVSKGRVLELARAKNAQRVRVDVVGLGKGPFDALVPEWKAEPYRASDKPWDETRFVNRKAEDAWAVRDLLEKNLLKLPNSPTLKAQMLGVKDEVDSKGRHKVIDPADSPDHFDAILMALAGEKAAGSAGFLSLIREQNAARKAAQEKGRAA